MSNITYMIGNGFDLACGLKSRYADSYESYISSESISDSVIRFKKTIKKEIETWADFELKLANYAKSLKSETEFVECVNDYRRFLNAYLDKEQKAFYDNGSLKGATREFVGKEMRRSLFQPIEGITPNSQRLVESALSDKWPRQYRFICFNYTNVLDSLVDIVFEEPTKYHFFPPVLHIHGTLEEGIVLGIDNENQLVDLPYSLSLRSKRNVIKPVFIDEYDDKRKKDAFSFIDISNVICVFGMSLGDSDLIWRTKIAEWLNKDNNHHLVFYSFDLSIKKYAASSNTEKMDDEEDFKREFIKILFNCDEKSDTVDRMMKQIHVPAGKPVFCIKDAIEEGKKEDAKRKQNRINRPKELGAR